MASRWSACLRLSAGAGGTLRYMSPEAVSGQPADEADDVRSPYVVLHETVSGQHPFAGGAAEEVAERIRCQRIGEDSAGPAGPDGEALLSLAAAVLTAPRQARPGSARAFAEALRGSRWAHRPRLPPIQLGRFWVPQVAIGTAARAAARHCNAADISKGSCELRFKRSCVDHRGNTAPEGCG